MKRFLVIEDNGIGYLVNYNGNDTLSFLQKSVDGLIACAPARIGSADVWVNDEGLYNPNFSTNFYASLITCQRLVGPAVVASSDEAGETQSVPEFVLDWLRFQGLIIHEVANIDDVIRLRPVVA